MKFENGVEYLTRLRITFYALLAGPLLVFFFLILQESKEMLPTFIELEASTVKVLTWVMSLLLIAVAAGAYTLYNRDLELVRDQDNLREKLDTYWKVNVKKYLLLEIACILALITFFLTLIPMFKAVYIGLMVVMAISNPGLYSILKDLKADAEEAIILKKNLPIP